MKRIGLILALYCSQALGYSQDRPIHHTFNTTILAPGEHQIGITSNYKYGLLPDLEIGTFAILTATGIAPNLYLRHKMFKLDTWRTVFTTHLLPLYNDDQKSLQGYLSFNSSRKISNHSILTLGFLNYLALSTVGNSLTEEIAKTSVYVASASWDTYFGESLSYSLSGLSPVYGDIELLDDYSEIKAKIFFYNNIKNITGIFWNTLTWTPGSFNLEFGTLSTASIEDLNHTLYLNMFWRFGA